MMNNRRRMLMTAQGGADPEIYINGYVGGGLVHYWDGKDNRGIGEAHASSGFPWVDIAGTRDIVLTDRQEQATWVTTDFTADSLYITALRTYRQCFIFEDILDTSNGEVSIEVRFSAGNAGEASPFGLSHGNTTPTMAFYQDRGAGTVGIVANSTATYKQFRYITAPAEDTEYHTLTMTYKIGRATLRLYVNGILAGNYTPQPSVADFSARLTSGTLRTVIGSSNAQVANGIYLNPGYVSRICVYNRILSPEQVLSNYNNDIARFN